MTEKSPSEPEPAKGDPPPPPGSPALKQELVERLRPYVEPGRAEAAANAVGSLMIQQSGPLPLAAEFRRYNDVLPGAADRILAMAEREQQHRHGLETSVVNKEAGMKSRGQIYALCALVAMLSVVVLLVYWGHPKEGTALGSVIIVGVGALFLGQRWMSSSRPDADNGEAGD